MSALSIGLFGVSGLFILLAAGIHIGAALALIGVAGTSMIVGFVPAVSAASETFYHRIASFELITIPLFILMGYLASAGGVSNKVFRVINQWVYRIPGGLGISTIASCTAFGTVCGSSLVVSSVFGRICAPEMRRFGYEKKLSYGICASGGMIGMLIPPSILMVVYGVQSGESIGKLLVAGVTPGLLLFVLFSLTVMAIYYLRPEMIRRMDAADRPTWRERLWGLVEIWQIWVVALVIVGGIFGGIFNPTEAAAVGSVVLAAVLIASNIHRPRELWGMFKESFYETAGTTTMIFFVMGGASVFSQFLVMSGITEAVAVWVKGMNLSLSSLIWVLIAFYAVLGCFLDSTSMVCITVPIFNPIVVSMGADPIWYAMIVVMAIEVGLLTPPVGLNVYGAYAVAESDVTLEDIFKGVIPFFGAVWLAIIILVLYPPLSTFLPRFMLGL